MGRKRVEKRELEPDITYNSALVAKLINYVMECGKKSTAERVVYDAFELIGERTKQDPLEVFDLAIKNISPMLEVTSRRIGGATYQIPREVKGWRKTALALRWLLEATKAKKGKAMRERLASEIIDASKNEGAAIKKRENTQRMAEANRAFAHFSQ